MRGTLETRPYGKTGEQVSVLGLGGGSLAKHSHDEGVATVRRALELGISYFDTSPLYGAVLRSWSWARRWRAGPRGTSWRPRSAICPLRQGSARATR